MKNKIKNSIIFVSFLGLTIHIINKAMELFLANYNWFHPLRSIGIRALNLVTEKDHVQLSLFEDTDEKTKAQESLSHTIDTINSRFGHGSLIRASCLLDSRLTGFNPKEDHVIHPVGYFK